MGVRLITLVNGSPSCKLIALGALECQGGRLMFPLP